MNSAPSAQAKFDLSVYEQISTSDCFVCRIVAGHPLTPGVEVLYEDSDTIAFLNQFPTQYGYTLVCPRRHVERFEADLSADEWTTLQAVVQKVARAVSQVTQPIRMYTASWGSPERNSHVHIHLCPCPAGTPIEKQQLVAMDMPDGKYLHLDQQQAKQLAEDIKAALIGYARGTPVGPRPRDSRSPEG